MTTPLPRWLATLSQSLDRVRLPLGDKPIPIEEYENDTRYVLRAELPGVDPVRDIRLMVADGELTVDIERMRGHHHGTHSEFRYGSFRRVVTLPRRAKDETTSATYDDGILEVTVDLVRSAPVGRAVPIKPGPLERVGPL